MTLAYNSKSDLDDNDMVRVFTGLKENAITSNHVVNDIALGNLLRAESLWR